MNEAFIENLKERIGCLYQEAQEPMDDQRLTLLLILSEQISNTIQNYRYLSLHGPDQIKAGKPIKKERTCEPGT